MPRAFTRREPDLDGARVVVLGLGRSGLAATRAVAARGGRVTVYDRRSAAELGTAREEATRLGASVRCESEEGSLPDACDLVVTSPGVPGNHPLVRAAREREIPLWGEIELGARFCRGRVIGITGSNGKSTTTVMVQRILETAGMPAVCGGNLDVPFCDLLPETDSETIVTLELSSFQLETTASLEPEVAVLLNIAPDHIDRHGSFAAYREAKARLLDLQGSEATAILNADDPSTEELGGRVQGALLQFTSATAHDSADGFLEDGALRLRGDDGRVDELASFEELQVAGRHNMTNALAAALAARAVGCPLDAIRRALRAFRPLPHRLARVGHYGGIDFFDDSKATNPDAVLRALEAFPAGRVFLILGGRDKDANWTELIESVDRNAKTVLLVGEAADDLGSRLASTTPAESCGTIGRAVGIAWDRAEPGDVVLLSPGCASFDQYADYRARGNDFVEAVRGEALRRGIDAT